MKKVSVYWQDVNYYSDGKLHEPSKAYTEGIFIEEFEGYLFIKYPTTIITDKHGSYHHPLIKPKFIIIPKLAISSIEYHAQ